MDPLATVFDLQARQIEIAGGADVGQLLDAASSAIRDAAGSAISRSQTTVRLLGTREQWLAVPLQPAHAVTDVTVGGASVEFLFTGDRLWRADGWQSTAAPQMVEMTIDAGYDPVPADVVDLCCSLVAAQLAATDDGYDPKRNLASLRIDDYSEGYFKGEDEIVNPLELPTRTREWLRGRFGGSAHVIETY